MTKTTRFFIIGIVLSLALLGLWPSYQFYIETPEKIRSLVLSGVAELDEEEYTEQEIEMFKDARKVKHRAVSLGLDIRGGISILLEADFGQFLEKKGWTEDQLTPEIKAEAIEQIRQKLMDRLNPNNLSEIVIRKLGDARLTVQIPGESNFENIEKLIEDTGALEFKLVDEEATPMLDIDPVTMDVLNKEEILAMGNKEILPHRDTDRPPLVVHSKVEISGDRLEEANSQTDDYGAPAVGFRLDSQGGKDMARISRENINRRMAIILDNKIMSAPSFNSVIYSDGQITGMDNTEEAKRLALVLKTGALPTAVNIISKDIVGPSMGKELLQKSVTALGFGVLAVVVFMFIRYRLSGLIASVALLINGFLIFAILAGMNFTVSLPGIAGLILTMGMAIDANVLIFERIREEIFDQKKNIKEAVSEGYKKAFWSIFDANFTTLIAAFVLSSFGEGAIDGFAITLIVGILMSMFTALFMVRFVFEILMHYNVMSRYSWYHI